MRAANGRFSGHRGGLLQVKSLNDFTGIAMKLFYLEICRFYDTEFVK